jgi:hypothetical protein
VASYKPQRRLTHHQRRSKVERRQRCTVVANAPQTRRRHLTCRRLPVFLVRPPTTAFNLVSYSSTLRGCPTNFSLVYSEGLVSITAHLLILIAALKSLFTNSFRFLPSLVVLTDASRPSNFRSPFHLLFCERSVLFYTDDYLFCCVTSLLIFDFFVILTLRIMFILLLCK